MNKPEAPEWDVIIVGGGFAGLSAALMLGRARRRVLVIDSGEPRNRFAAHMHGVLGHDGYSPLQLLADGRDALLAATALEHGMTLATRDQAAFARVPRLKLFNPWTYKPEVVDEDEDWGQAAKAGAQWLRNIFVRG